MRLLFGIGLVLLSAGALAQEVSVRSLLPQMTDLTWVTRRPRPAFTMAQASSYDRRSNPGPNSDPFANADAGNFLRDEAREGRTEQVMADLRGPGAVVRIWSANPQGTIRFYFDGETTPRLAAPMADLLGGKLPPFGEPFAYVASRGANLYFPLPYARRLKITVEGSKGLYYQVGYRTYAPGTRVRTFSTTDLPRAQIARTARALRGAAPEPMPAQATELRTVAARGALVRKLTRGGAISELRVRVPFPLARRPLGDWSDPLQPHNVLRRLILTIRFDGETCVRVPLGDFFATAPGVNPVKTYPIEVRGDGTMIARFVMPFRRTAEIEIANGNGFPVPVEIGASTRPYRWTRDSYYFHSQWRVFAGRTRPMVDMTLLKARGEGMWVGTSLAVANSSPAWWGEGDEKVYVDGEAFPSTFGTGTEDYFGYAWSSNQPFQMPYHAQSRSDGPANFGNSMIMRFQTFDPIPYRRSLRFDLEKWHWADVEATYAATAYWYARPGGTEPAPIDSADLAPPYLPKPEPVKGAIEGETLTIRERTGGQTSAQEGFWQLSGGKQLWWVDPKVGDRLVLEVPVPEAGKYEVIGNLGFAPDYGVFRLRLNGREIPPIDFYAPSVEWKRTSLGIFDLPKGVVLLEVEAVGSSPKALPRRMFGLDYLLLTQR